MSSAVETDKKSSMMRHEFRRSSSAERGERMLLVQVSEIPTILNRMGQKVDTKKLMHFIDTKIDTEHTGHLDYNKFTLVCEKFLTDAAVLEKVKGDDFNFKHLITCEDMYNP